MKTLRKNVDLPTETVAVLQIEATLKGFGSLKPFLELVLKDFASKTAKSRPRVYEAVVEKKGSEIGETEVRQSLHTNRQISRPEVK